MLLEPWNFKTILIERLCFNVAWVHQHQACSPVSSPRSVHYGSHVGLQQQLAQRHHVGGHAARGAAIAIRAQRGGSDGRHLTRAWCRPGRVAGDEQFPGAVWRTSELLPSSPWRIPEHGYGRHGHVWWPVFSHEVSEKNRNPLSTWYFFFLWAWCCLLMLKILFFKGIFSAYLKTQISNTEI